MKCDAVVLAAGKGTRLWPFTETQAKPAIKIIDKPLIHYVLDFLKANGVEKPCIIVNHCAEDVISAVESYGMKARFVRQDEPKGTGHALMVAEKYVGDRFIVANGDVLLTSNVTLPENSILLVERPHNGEFGTPVLKNGVLVDMREKERGDMINGGVYHLRDEVFNHLADLEPSPRGEYEITDILPKLGLRAVTVRGDQWLDVGRPWDLLSAARILLSRIPERRDGEIEPRATLKGKVIVSEGAEVRNGAYIKGPAYIGSGATVGPNAYIRSYSVIQENARVGNAVEIKASFLMDGAHASHLSYVGDSVIGRDVNFGAGTITANLRFDDKPVLGVRRKMGAFVGDSVKTGVHVSLMPGVRVGSGAWIFPGSIVYSDVPSSAKVSGIYRGSS